MTNTGKFIVLVMLLVIAGLIYVLVKQAGTPSVTPTPTVTPIEEAVVTVTPSGEPEVTNTTAPTTAVVASVTPPAGWKELVNDGQGYTAYRPGNWWFRFFPPSKQLLGIDPNPIPEVGEYAGAITISRLTGGTTFNDYKSGLEAGYTESPSQINGRTWTMVEGVIPENEISGKKYVKYGYVEVGSKKFVAGLMSGAANYNGYESIFDTFLSVLVFN